MAARKTRKPPRRLTSKTNAPDGLKEVLALVPSTSTLKDSATATYNGLSIVRATMRHQFGIDPLVTKKPQHIELAFALLTIMLEDARSARRLLSRDERSAAKIAQRAQNDEDRRTKLDALLRKHQGNVSKVAREMDKGRNQIVRWIEQYGLNPHSYRSV